MEFLAQVSKMDLDQGNYRQTSLEKYREYRNKKLWDVDERFIEIFEWLKAQGYKVFVYEMLSRKGRRGHRTMEVFAHFWLPEYNMAIRLTKAVTKDMVDAKLKQFIRKSRKYFYVCPINTNEDFTKKIPDTIERVKVYAKEEPRKGVCKDMYFPPKPIRKKRKRIVITEKA